MTLSESYINNTFFFIANSKVKRIIIYFWLQERLLQSFIKETNLIFSLLPLGPFLSLSLLTLSIHNLIISVMQATYSWVSKDTKGRVEDEKEARQWEREGKMHLTADGPHVKLKLKLHRAVCCMRYHSTPTFIITRTNGQKKRDEFELKSLNKIPSVTWRDYSPMGGVLDRPFSCPESARASRAFFHSLGPFLTESPCSH